MAHGGSDLNVANIILAFVVPIVSAIVSASIAHRLAHERARADTARQIYGDIFRILRRYRVTLWHSRLSRELLRDTELSEAIRLGAWRDLSETSLEGAGYSADLVAITVILSTTFGKKAMKLVEVLKEHFPLFAEASEASASVEETENVLKRLDDLRSRVLDEVNSLNRSLNVFDVD